MVNKERDVIECICDSKDLEVIKGIKKKDLVTIFGENCVCALRKKSGERVQFGTAEKDVLITAT